VIRQQGSSEDGRSGPSEELAMGADLGRTDPGQIEDDGRTARDEDWPEIIQETETGTGSRASSKTKRIEDEAAAAAGRGGRRPGRAMAAAARREEELTYCSDTMLGIDKLYSLGPKATTYSYMYR
jgi:hypothetical protein